MLSPAQKLNLAEEVGEEIVKKCIGTGELHLVGSHTFRRRTVASWMYKASAKQLFLTKVHSVVQGKYLEKYGLEVADVDLKKSNIVKSISSNQLNCITVVLATSAEYTTKHPSAKSQTYVLSISAILAQGLLVVSFEDT